MDHPPSTPSSPRVAARRALLTTAAALTVLTAPVGVVAATAGDSTPATAEVHTQGQGGATRFVYGLRDQLGEGRPVLRQHVEAGLQGLQGLPEATPLPPAAPAVPAEPTPTTAPPASTTTTTAAPAPAQVPAATAAPYADPADPATWDRLARCESGGNWSTNTGNGYYGGLQFSASTWRSVGGTGLPHQATREVQIEMGQRLQARSGWGQWPHCTRKLGYR